MTLSKRSPVASDHYLSSDVGHYNVPAEGRFLRRVGIGILVAGVFLAVAIAVLDAFQKMATAFTSFSSLLEHGPWMQFLGGLGVFTKTGLFVLAGVLVWQLSRRRRKRKIARSDQAER